MSDNRALDQVAYWNDEAGPRWVAGQERMDTLMAPLTEAALARARPSPGERVIDVGCGCGATVLAIADRVGATGSVLGVDISQPMLARASRTGAGTRSRAGSACSWPTRRRTRLILNRPISCSRASGSCSSTILSRHSPMFGVP